MHNVYEQFFFLKYAGNWSFSEAYNLPIGLRRWFVDRLIQQIEKENEAVEQAQAGSSPNSSFQPLTTNNQPPMPPRYRQNTP